MTQPSDIGAISHSAHRMTRRMFGIGAGAAIVGGSLFAANWYNVGASLDGADLLSVQEVHKAANDGSVLLIDIRRPDEWQRTGVGQGAVPLDMRRDDFIDVLAELTQGDRAAPVALICARGVRSRRMSARLTEAGFTRIIDVPEGMLGSGAGPGWLKAGLPIETWQE